MLHFLYTSLKSFSGSGYPRSMVRALWISPSLRLLVLGYNDVAQFPLCVIKGRRPAPCRYPKYPASLLSLLIIRLAQPYSVEPLYIYTHIYIQQDCPSFDLHTEMKSFATIVAFAASANALAIRSDSCCFGVTASGGASGTVGQLSDGQNRIGGGLSPASYCISPSGVITDSSGRGCILTRESFPSTPSSYEAVQL